MNNVDFKKLTPIEYICVADRERVHTETLRWLLDENSPIYNNRNKFLEYLTGSKEFRNCNILKSSTEFNKLDLLVELTCNGKQKFIIIENKLKSPLYRDQLNEYDESIEKNKEIQSYCHKYYLTLLSEEIRNTDWNHISYLQLLKSIEKVKDKAIKHRTYLRNYYLTLARLKKAIELVREEPNKYAGNGVVFEHETTQSPPADFSTYISILKLRTLLQKAWMQKLGENIISNIKEDFEDWSVDVSHGNALIDFVIKKKKKNNTDYLIGVQLQYEKFKIFCYPKLDSEKNVNAVQNQEVVNILNKLKNQLKTYIPDIDEKKMTKSRNKGFRSFTFYNEHLSKTLSISKWSNEFQKYLNTLRKAF